MGTDAPNQNQDAHMEHNVGVCGGSFGKHFGAFSILFEPCWQPFPNQHRDMFGVPCPSRRPLERPGVPFGRIVGSH